jgi:hypothetical protein
MNVSGKYLNSNEFLDCNLIIKNGKIYTIDIENDISLNFFLSNKNHGSDYELIENIDSKNSPYNSNYILKYFGGSEKPSLIYLKLNWLEIILLKYAMRIWLIQSDDIRRDFLKYIIGGICGIIITIGTQEVNQRYKAEPEIPPKAGSQKSLEPKNLNTETKNDKIIINSIKNTSDLNGAEAKPKIVINKKPKA